MKKQKKSAVEKAFERSDKHVLDGIKLRPWTPSRVIAANCMGMTYPRLGKAGWDQYERTQNYPGAVKDTIIALWLCAVDEDQVAEADLAPRDAYRQAQEWATRRGIHNLKSDAFWQAFSKFIEIVSEVEASATTPEDDGDEGDDPNG